VAGSITGPDRRGRDGGWFAVRVPPGRPRTRSTAARSDRPALSRAHIVRTALALIDRDGVEALTMRRFGAELGVDPMAVYHYVPTKAALFDGVVEAVHDEIDLDGIDPGEGWRATAVAAARSLRAVLRRHPNALPILATRPVYSARVLDQSERMLALVTAGGLAPRDALHLVSCLRAFTVGHVLVELGDPVGGASGGPDATAITDARYPVLAAAVHGGYDADRQYQIGLAALVDGFPDTRAVD
jgi:TetR/AcrR family transcriptional regulator, tetracycline repressor protein